jgi:cytochrome P450
MSTSMHVANGRVPTPVPLFPGHPIFGHLQDFRHDRAAAQLRIGRERPEAARLRMGLFHLTMVSSPALAHEVLATKNASFVKSPGLTIFMKPLLGKGLLTSERTFHTAQRKLLAPAFAHKRIAAYADTMAERAARVAAGLEDGATVDAADMMMRLTLEIVGKTLFDTEVGADADIVGEALTTAMETSMEQLTSLVPIPPFIPTPKNLRSRHAVQALDDVLYRIIRARRGEGDRGDLLSILLETKDEAGVGMSDQQVRDEAMTLFLAGHETTANALAWALYLLARHPAARAKVEEEIDRLGHAPSYDDLKHLPYTLAVLKETMRLYPPAYILARRAIENVVIGDHELRRNTIVVVNVLGIHRRADSFPDPEAFRPERFLGDLEKQLPRCAYLPFGAGPRVCIGNHFATMEGHVLLATLLRRVRLDLATDAEVEVEPLITLRPKGGIPMRIAVRAERPV